MTLVVVEDTMRYGQVTKSYGTNVTRNFKVGKNKLSTTLNGMYQDAKINNETNSTLYNSGIEAFVSGQITSVDNKQYKISIKLFHLYHEKSKEKPFSPHIVCLCVCM